MDRNSDIELSVLIPIYNEETVLPHLYERTKAALEGLGANYEVIFINDCSVDNSFALIKGFNKVNPAVKCISFSRNFGHQIAITAGLNFTNGKAVMIIDGDLQDPPEIIPEFLKKWKEGNEVVYGVRLKRKENFIKKILYKLYYRILSRLSEIKIPHDSGDCCLMDRKVVDLLNSMPERNRFVRGLRSWIGFKQIGVEYERGKRYAGQSKYSLFKLLKLGFDGIISFSGIPLRISILAGFLISLLSIFFSFYLILNRLLQWKSQIPGWTSIIVGVTFLGGIQLMVIGLMGEYIVRIYDEAKSRPQYIVESLVGLKE